MRRLVTAAALDVVGSAAVLILVALGWVRVQIVREAPFADVVVSLSGRTVAPAVFGAAVVTLAGAVAALATRGRARRIVGVVVVLASVGTVASAVSALGAPSDAAARRFVAQAIADRSSTGAVVPITDGTVTVAVHAVWPWLAALAAVLTVAAGVLWTLPERVVDKPGGLGPRYDAPVATERPRDATLWSALDHGDDPTAGDPDAAPTGGERDPHTSRTDS